MYRIMKAGKLWKWLDGSIHIFYKNTELKIKERYSDNVKQVS